MKKLDHSHKPMSPNKKNKTNAATSEHIHIPCYELEQNVPDWVAMKINKRTTPQSLALRAACQLPC